MSDRNPNRAFLRLKYRIWDSEIRREYATDAVAEGKTSASAADRLLREMWQALEAWRMLPVSCRDPTDPSRMIHVRQQAKAILPDAFLSHMADCLAGHFNDGLSLDQAFGIKRSKGRPRMWTDFRERLFVSEFYRVQMVARDHGLEILDAPAAEKAANRLNWRALSSETELYRRGLTERAITDTWLKGKKKVWWPRLQELETSVIRTAFDVVDRSLLNI